VPHPAPLHGDELMEVQALGPRETRTHALGSPPPQLGERHHLNSGGQSHRSGEAEFGYLGNVSHFDHVLSSRYPSGPDPAA
jgi:hypothetical protein